MSGRRRDYSGLAAGLTTFAQMHVARQQQQRQFGQLLALGLLRNRQSLASALAHSGRLSPEQAVAFMQTGQLPTSSHQPDDLDALSTKASSLVSRHPGSKVTISSMVGPHKMSFTLGGETGKERQEAVASLVEQRRASTAKTMDALQNPIITRQLSDTLGISHPFQSKVQATSDLIDRAMAGDQDAIAQIRQMRQARGR